MTDQMPDWKRIEREVALIRERHRSDEQERKKQLRRLWKETFRGWR